MVPEGGGEMVAEATAGGDQGGSSTMAAGGRHRVWLSVRGTAGNRGEANGVEGSGATVGQEGRVRGGNSFRSASGAECKKVCG